jgi:hypothetical protein
MKNNFPKIPMFLSAIFFVFFCLAFLFFYKMINSNDKESQLKEGEWQSETTKRDEIRALDYSVKIMEGERDQLETHFAQSSDVVPFLNTIDGLAGGVDVKEEVTSVDVEADNTSLLVGMKASGTFSNLYKFLTLLENSPYELEFTGVDMRKETVSEVGNGNKNVPVPKWDAVYKIKLLSFVK